MESRLELFLIFCRNNYEQNRPLLHANLITVGDELTVNKALSNFVHSFIAARRFDNDEYCQQVSGGLRVCLGVPVPSADL